MMGLKRNFLLILLLLTIVWATFLVVSYAVAITVFYTLEYPQISILMSISRVAVGLVIMCCWIIAWYKLTKLWLYRILLRKREI